ncbi:MAG: AraC family transcriptional regulator [Cyclobacteriaceae bacterium]
MNDKKESAVSRKVVFAVFPGVHLLDLTGPAHLFYEAIDYGADYELTYFSVGDEKVIKSSAGMMIGELVSFSQLQLREQDIIIIPGMEAHYYMEVDIRDILRSFLHWLSNQSVKRVTICSVCTGAFVLAASGLLDGKSCTTHWRYCDRFADRYPKIEVIRNRLFVENDNLLTSAGVSSGIDLALHLIERHHGSRFAADIAREVVIYLRRGEEEPQLSIFLRYRNHLVDPIHTVQDYLLKSFHLNPSLEELADLAHTSERNLTRMFKKATGITIGKYQELLRIEKADQLIKEGNKMEVVAKSCGYADVSQLYKLLKKT